MTQKGLVVLDVDSPGEYVKCHIVGSQNLAWGQDHGAFAQAVEKAYGKNRAFILYGSDITSAAGANAAKFLREHGFDAQDYPGGLKEWREAGFPVEGNATSQKPGVR